MHTNHISISLPSKNDLQWHTTCFNHVASTNDKKGNAITRNNLFSQEVSTVLKLKYKSKIIYIDAHKCRSDRPTWRSISDMRILIDHLLYLIRFAFFFSVPKKRRYIKNLTESFQVGKNRYIAVEPCCDYDKDSVLFTLWTLLLVKYCMVTVKNMQEIRLPIL
jgi:hypothetical protein